MNLTHVVKASIIAVSLGFMGIAFAASTGAVPPNEVRQAQERLSFLGFYTEDVNGYMGLETERAIAAFQQHNGIQPTGQLDRRTQVELQTMDSLERASRDGGRQGDS